MRVVYLAAGAAGMICGSCLRDNRLVATLREHGRDALLVPLYTPIRTDEVDVSERRVLFGGINVFLQQASAVFRYLPRFVERWLDTPRLIRTVTRGAASTDPATLGPLTVSVLRGVHGKQGRSAREMARDLAQLRPAVVNLPNLMMLGLAPAIREATGARIVCTLSGEDIFLDALPEPSRSQAFELIADRARDVDAHVALTHYYARHAIEHFDLPRERVHVVSAGVRPDDFEPAADPSGAPITIGYLARICPEKGLHRLVDAFIALCREGHDIRLRIAGYLGGGDRDYLARQLRNLAGAGVRDRVDYLGEVDRAEKCALLRSLQLFCIPSDYPEAKGISVLEALAAGVPVVLPAHGAYPEMVDATGGGVLVPPNDADALRGALAALVTDADERTALAQRGRSAARRLYSDAAMASGIWRLYGQVVGTEGA